jgi:hypothetical protein
MTEGGYNPDLLTLIPWVLERLVRREYRVTLDNEGSLQALELDPDCGVPSTDKIEEDLKAILPWERLEKLFALRDHRTPEQVLEALTEFPFLPSVIGAPLVLPPDELSRATWSEIVSSAYWSLRRFSEIFNRSIIASRIGLGDPIVAELESGMQWMRPDALPVAAAQYVAYEMSELYPAVAERLRAFQITPVSQAVPKNVAQYAREASRCYLYGFFSACWALCRSCVESGIEERLVHKGLTKELRGISYSKVQEMLKLALKSGVLDSLVYEMANDIRTSANKAIHGTMPSEAECRDRLEKTRAVLRHLYE